VRPADLALAISRAFALTNYPKVGLVPDIPDWFMGTPWGLTDEEMQHKDAFKKIPIVHALVRLIQNDAAALPRRFYQGEREIQRKFGNVADVFEGANARDTGHQFLLNLFGDLELFGNSYIYLERGRSQARNRPPYALWTLHPPFIKIVPGKNRTVSEYLWYGAGAPESIAPWSVIHVAKYNPSDEQTGITWVEPAREDWMAQWHALRILRQFYARGGLVPGTWAITDGKGRPPKDAEIKAAQTAYARRFQSIDNLFKLIVVEGMEQIEKGQTVRELMLNENITLMNANVCRAAGVPPWMMGIKESGSLDQGKSSETSSENYWRSTIGNVVRLVDSVLNERLCPLFGEDITIETDMESVPALQAARLEMMKGAVLAAEDAVVSVNEAREWWGAEATGRPEDELPRQRPSAPAFGEAPGLRPGEEPEPEEEIAPEEEEAAAIRPSRNGHHFAGSNPRQRTERLRRRQDKRLAREEQRMAAVWNSIRLEQAERAERLLQDMQRDSFARFEDRAIDIDPEKLYAISVEQRERLRQRIEEAMAQAAADAADEIGVAAAIDLHSTAVQNYIRARTDVMIQRVSITDRTRLRELIAEAVDDEKQWSEIVGKVRDFFDGRRANSMTIARTEMAGPYNRAALSTWQAGGVRKKFWLTMGDEAVRDTHRIAGDTYSEQESIPIGDPFYVGGVATQEPGGTGVAELDINCRCAVLPDLEDFEDLLVAKRQPANRLAWLLNGVEGSA
jgi:phage portal protein BeeE